MYYKELIKQLRKQNQSLAVYNDSELARCLEDAATAIETLLKKLDDTQDRLQDLQTTLDMYGGECGINEAFRKAEELNMAIDGVRIMGCKS